MQALTNDFPIRAKDMWDWFHLCHFIYSTFATWNKHFIISFNISLSFLILRHFKWNFKTERMRMLANEIESLSCGVILINTPCLYDNYRNILRHHFRYKVLRCTINKILFSTKVNWTNKLQHIACASVLLM